VTDPGLAAHLKKPIDKSGFPFQLAVERELRKLGRGSSWDVATEVPVGDTFAEIVLRSSNLMIVVECKRVDGDRWHFLLPKGANSNVARCRVEWHNSRATRPSMYIAGCDVVFCSECTMAEGSYEANVCVIPKGSPVSSLEALSRYLLGITHQLGDLGGLQYDASPTYVIPVIVTNAELSICEYRAAALDIESGRLGVAEFASADFVRFRKTLVSRRSNDYELRAVSLQDWTSDRERTVFVVSPQGLARFVSGFRAFKYAGEGEHPPQFTSPPRWGIE
jgi:hypothetical protein